MDLDQSVALRPKRSARSMPFENAAGLIHDFAENTVEDAPDADYSVSCRSSRVWNEALRQ